MVPITAVFIPAIMQKNASQLKNLAPSREDSSTVRNSAYFLSARYCGSECKLYGKHTRLLLTKQTPRHKGAGLYTL